MSSWAGGWGWEQVRPLPTLEQPVPRGGNLQGPLAQGLIADTRPPRAGLGRVRLGHHARPAGSQESSIYSRTVTKHLFWIRLGSRLSRDKVRPCLMS